MTFLKKPCGFLLLPFVENIKCGKKDNNAVASYGQPYISVVSIYISM